MEMKKKKKTQIDRYGCITDLDEKFKIKRTTQILFFFSIIFQFSNIFTI